ncbi:MAG: hypothetical protein CMB50_02875 [Euryarchaeota archaeon]|nr:hypothetical protein [Euryarchaeota archaeon]
MYRCNGGACVSGLYKRSICAVMTVLFLTMSLPGCLSLVYGREIMEGVRGEPKIDEDWRVYDLSHTFVLEGADAFSQIQETKTEQIEIDETVSEVVIIFKTSVNYHLGESDQRYVSVQLLWCDEFGSNCDTSNPIYEVMADNGSYPQETIEIDRDITQFEDGMWLLSVDGRGGGTNTGISTLDFEDSWLLRVRVVRPCLQFPESPTECTPLIDL